MAHVLFGKPVPTFPGHALGAQAAQLSPLDVERMVTEQERRAGPRTLAGRRQVDDRKRENAPSPPPAEVGVNE
jgi:hypothetical protein